MVSKVQHSITALYYHCRCKGKPYKVFLMETSTIIINALMANNFNSEKGTQVGERNIILKSRKG